MTTSLQATPLHGQGRWSKLPDALLGVLTPREHQVIHLLLSYRWSDDALIYPSVRTMAKRLGCSERTIQRAIRGLERGGWIVVEARYRDDEGQQSNQYHPGPRLLPLLPAARVTLPPSRPSAKREYPKQSKQMRSNQSGYTPALTDPRRYLVAPGGGRVHT